MTSACGIVEEPSEKGGSFSDRASFKAGDLEARGDIFEEFYYSVESLSVLKYQPVKSTYTVGDEIPVSGESYSYPDSFDIIVLRDSVAISVRNKAITDIKSVADYTYNNVPVINGRGFEIKVSSDADVKSFLSEYEETSGSTEFFNKWMNFDTYRKVVLQSK
jgi:sulfate adenylyltransferase subunit 1